MKLIMANKFHRPQGGCETVYFSEIEGLKKQGVEVAEFSMLESNSSESDYKKYFTDEVAYENLNLLGKVNAAVKTVYNFDAKNKLESLISDFVPDIFHAHNIYHQISPSIFSATEKYDIPSIMTSHDLKLACPNYKMYVNDALCTKCLNGSYWNCALNRCSKGSLINSTVNMVEAYIHKYANLYGKLDRIICPSEFNANMLIRAGYDERKISILPNGINIEELTVSTSNDGYILFVGRVTKDKGVGSIIEVARLLPNVLFKIVGDGPDKIVFEQLCSDLNNVTFLGFKQRNEVDKLIAGASAVIVSSLLYENCPMSVLETMALGKIVIASRIGGIPEIVKDNFNGFLYDNSDIHSLKDAIEKVMLNSNDLRVIEKNARLTIEKNYTEQSHLKGLLAIYKELLS